MRCLKTALEALDGIVTQGEGAPGHSEDSHYQRFLTIQREFEELLAARAAFVPARPAAHNPVMRRPPTPEGKLWIQLQPAADLVDLVNAVYTHMLKLLAQAYAETRGTQVQRPLVDAATDLMYAITPVASALTRLPANVEQPECTAGMSFATVRTAAALPPGPLADKVLIERLREIAAVADQLLKDTPSLSNVATRLERISNRLSKPKESSSA